MCMNMNICVSRHCEQVKIKTPRHGLQSKALYDHDSMLWVCDLVRFMSKNVSKNVRKMQLACVFTQRIV